MEFLYGGGFCVTLVAACAWWALRGPRNQLRGKS